MTNFLPTSYSDRPAYHPDELLPQEEVDAIIEREQREADAYARDHRKVRPIAGVRVKYSEDQERDDHGRFGSGSSGEIAGQAATLNSGKEIDPESKLGRAITARTGGGDYSNADHRVIVDAIQAAPPNAPELYRGFLMNEANGWSPEQTAAFTSALQVNGVVDMRLGSWSDTMDVAEDFAATRDGAPVSEADERAYTSTGTFAQYEDERVIVTAAPGSQSLNVGPNSAADFEWQSEWNTLGMFRIDSVEHTGQVWSIHVTQMDSEEPGPGHSEGGDANDRRTL